VQETRLPQSLLHHGERACHPFFLISPLSVCLAIKSRSISWMKRFPNSCVSWFQEHFYLAIKERVDFGAFLEILDVLCIGRESFHRKWECGGMWISWVVSPYQYPIRSSS
jgi:hypothetical protein